MKVFSKEKFFEVEGRIDYDMLKSIGIPDKYIWQDICDGKEPINGKIEGYFIRDKWCIDIDKEENNPYKIIIECDGNDVTTAKMIINGKTVKESKAKRNPEDKFDFKIASCVAFDRLFSREKRKEVKRPAKAGETIKIVNPINSKNVYKKGDIFNVEERCDDLVQVKVYVNVDNEYLRFRNEPNTACVYDEEYVVLE